MEIIKNCENCLYYLQHYIKRQKNYNAVCCGHCTKLKRNKSLSDFCKRWESNETVKEQRKVNIKKTLLKMAQQVNEMALLLKDEFD